MDIYTRIHNLNLAWHEMEKFIDMSQQNANLYNADELERYQEYSTMKYELQEIKDRVSKILIPQLEIYMNDLLGKLYIFLDIHIGKQKQYHRNTR